MPPSDYAGRGDSASSDCLGNEVRCSDQLDPLNASAHPNASAYRVFPVSALPHPVDDFVVAGAKAIGCDPSFLSLPLLTSAAAAIGNSRRLQIKRGWYAPPILWCAIVGESGTAKTPAFSIAMRPVRERQHLALERLEESMRDFETKKARYEEELAAWKRRKKKDLAEEPPIAPEEPRAERLVVSDATIEALAPILKFNWRGVLVARDELAAWLGSFDRYAGKAGADLANWLSLFNGEPIYIDRKTGTPPFIYVPRASVCVCGGIQPGILRRALAPEHRESGLAARLLLAWPPRMPKRWTEADIDPDIEAALERVFGGLYELQPKIGEDGAERPGLVRFAPDAKNAWIHYYNAHAEEQAELSGDLSAAWSKLEEYAPRLALIIHCIRWAAQDPTLADPGILDETSMGAGIRLAEWFKHEARRVYAMFNETYAEEDQRKLIEWVARKSRAVTPREAQQGCRWLRESGTAEKALDALVRAGLGKWIERPTTEKGGQPTRAFALLTSSGVYETRDSQGEKEVA